MFYAAADRGDRSNSRAKQVLQLKAKHCKFLQPELGPWVQGSPTVGAHWQPPRLEGWEPPAH